MDFSRTPYVKIYSGVSPTSTLWGFFGRMLMDALVKAADRAGVIDLPPELRGDLHAAVASILGCPDVAWVREHLPKIMEHGSVVHITLDGDDGDAEYLVLMRYHEGQYANMDPSFSTMWSKRKRRDTERAIDLGLIEAPFWWREKEEGAA